jgi:hypothetical protein
MIEPKVFGIGFHKTATTSLAAALTTLGYRVTGPDWVSEPDIEHRAHDLAIEAAERFDGFQDNPWPLLYRDLDQRFPGSRFVLTVRETEPWIRSVVRHFGTGETPMRRWIYGFGSPVGHEDVYVERYERHNREVRDYFRERPDDLLEMDITQGDAWEKLCPFLGVPVPQADFPHRNRMTARERAARKDTLKSRIRSLGGNG